MTERKAKAKAKAKAKQMQRLMQEPPGSSASLLLDGSAGVG
jgi:hypothetical protein